MAKRAVVKIEVEQGLYERLFEYDELTINESRDSLTLVATRRED